MSVEASAQSMTIRKCLVSWERLRLLYNIIMLLAGIWPAIMVYGAWQQRPQFIQIGPVGFSLLVVLYGLAANILFGLAPMLDVYLAVFRGRSLKRSHRIAIFLFGVVFSLVVIVISFFLGIFAVMTRADMIG